MKKVIKWILIFLGTALISRHPVQIFYAFIVLLIITGIALLFKLAISSRKGRQAEIEK